MIIKKINEINSYENIINIATSIYGEDVSKESKNIKTMEHVAAGSFLFATASGIAIVTSLALTQKKDKDNDEDDLIFS